MLVVVRIFQPLGGRCGRINIFRALASELGDIFIEISHAILVEIQYSLLRDWNLEDLFHPQGV